MTTPPPKVRLLFFFINNQVWNIKTSIFIKYGNRDLLIFFNTRGPISTTFWPKFFDVVFPENRLYRGNFKVAKT